MRSNKMRNISKPDASARSKKGWQTRKKRVSQHLTNAGPGKKVAFAAGVAFTSGIASNAYSYKKHGKRSTNPTVIAAAAAGATYARHRYNQRKR